MNECRITIQSHNFVIDQIQFGVVPIIRNYAKTFIQHEWKRLGRNPRPQKVNKCVFAASPVDGREYRFAKRALDEFLEYLRFYGVPKERILIVNRPMYTPEPAKLVMPKTWVAREKQVPIIEYVCSPGEIKVVNMQTGQGKTDLSLKAAEILSQRLFACMPAKYIQQWAGKVRDRYGLKPGEFVVVQGFKQLLAVMQLLHVGEFSASVMLVTSTTMQKYLQYYEHTRVKERYEWYITPDDLYERLGIGLRLLDEGHEFFHLNFKMDLYMHVPKSLVLSATLEPDDEFMGRMYKLIFPMDARMNGGAYVKYIDVTALMYHLEDWQNVKCTGGQGYNHVMYEQWIIKRPRVLGNYLQLIYDVVNTDFLKKKKDGQRMLIYAATVEMCQIIRDYLDEMVMEDVVISKYTSDDSFDLLITSDITVTTLGSAGTGVDVPDLLVCFMTTALSSSQRNLQVLGRLRELQERYKDQNPLFVYLACRDIAKHMEYHRKKEELFVGKVLSHRVTNYTRRV